MENGRAVCLRGCEGNSGSTGADWDHTVDTVPDDTEDAEDDDFEEDI